MTRFHDQALCNDKAWGFFRIWERGRLANQISHIDFIKTLNIDIQNLQDTEY